MPLSCAIKVVEINGEKYNEQKSYFIAGETNKLLIKPKLWVFDSISHGELIKEKELLIFDFPDTSSYYFNEIFFHSKQLKRKKSIKIPVSREPNLSIKLYPYDLGDTIHFDNIRFLKPKLVSDSSSFLTVRKNVDGFYFSSSNNYHDIHTDGFFFEKQLDSIFLSKPQKIFIDSVYYMIEGETFNDDFNVAFDIVYPEKHLYRELDKNGRHHVNSLKTLTYFPEKKNLKRPNDTTLWEVKYDLAKINTYINLGGIPGTNHILVRDNKQNVIYDRIIDGNNPRIEDLLGISEYDEIFVELKGKNKNWKITIHLFDYENK